MDAEKEENDYVYIIPHNYTDNGKILGIIEVKSLYLALAWFVPLTYVIFRFLPYSFTIKLFVEIIVVMPVTIFALVGIGSDTLIDFLSYVRHFYKNAKCYTYEK